jgi:hypothetical protein
MKGSRVVLVLAAVVIILGAPAIWAQEQYSTSITKVISPGRATVVCDTDVFTFQADEYLVVTFEKLSAARVKFTVARLVRCYQVEEISVHWGGYPPVGLLLGSSGGDSFILDTETGYAEK